MPLPLGAQYICELQKKSLSQPAKYVDIFLGVLIAMPPLLLRLNSIAIRSPDTRKRNGVQYMNTIAVIAGFFVMVATTHSFGMLPAIVIGVFVGGMVRVFLSVFRGTGNAPVTNPQESAFAETVSYKAELNGASEVPATTSTASGTLTATFDTSSKKLTWKGDYTGLTGEVTAAHFHGPAEAGKNAGVVVPIDPAKSPIR